VAEQLPRLTVPRQWRSPRRVGAGAGGNSPSCTAWHRTRSGSGGVSWGGSSFCAAGPLPSALDHPNRPVSPWPRRTLASDPRCSAPWPCPSGAAWWWIVVLAFAVRLLRPGQHFSSPLAQTSFILGSFPAGLLVGRVASPGLVGTAGRRFLADLGCSGVLTCALAMWPWPCPHLTSTGSAPAAAGRLHPSGFRRLCLRPGRRVLASRVVSHSVRVRGGVLVVGVGRAGAGSAWFLSVRWPTSATGSRGRVGSLSLPAALVWCSCPAPRDPCA